MNVRTSPVRIDVYVDAGGAHSDHVSISEKRQDFVRWHNEDGGHYQIVFDDSPFNASSFDLPARKGATRDSGPARSGSGHPNGAQYDYDIRAFSVSKNGHKGAKTKTVRVKVIDPTIVVDV